MHCQLPGTKAPHGSKGTHKCIAQLSQIEHRHPCMDVTYSCTCDLLPACVSALACVMHCQLPSTYCTRHCRMNRFMIHVTAYAIDALPAAKYQSIAWCSLLTLSCQEDTQLQYLVGTQFAHRYRRLGALEIVKSFPNRCVSTSRLHTNLELLLENAPRSVFPSTYSGSSRPCKHYKTTTIPRKAG